MNWVVHNGQNNNFSVMNATDHRIEGKMIIANMVISPLLQIVESDLKSRVLHQLAKELHNQNCVEYTKTLRPDGDVEIKARIYAVSNDKVFILRTFDRA